MLVSVLSVVLARAGNFTDAVTVAQWAVTAMIAIVGPIIGFYFGSKAAPTEPKPEVKKEEVAPL
jgi:hypothetical protein